MPQKLRVSRLGRIREQRLAEFEKFDFNPELTFDHSGFGLQDKAKYRRYQKRNLDLKKVVTDLFSSDPVLFVLAKNRLLLTKPENLAKLYSTSELKGIINFIKKHKYNESFEQVLNIFINAFLIRCAFENKFDLINNFIKNEINSYTALLFSGSIEFVKDVLSLVKWAKHENQAIRHHSVKALLSLGKKGVDEVYRLIKHANYYVKETAIEGLCEYLFNLGPKGIKELESLTLDKDKLISETAEVYLYSKGRMLQKFNVRKQIPMRDSALLIGDMNPVYANRNLEQIIKKTKAISKITEILETEFEDDFTGIVIFGSISKGYANDHSDIDYAIVAKTREVGERFDELARRNHLPMCAQYFVIPEVSVDMSRLFYGLFFGNRVKLKELQKRVFERLSPAEWEKIRENIIENSFNLKKAFDRLYVAHREKLRLLGTAALKVPPSYEEMQRYFDSIK